MELPTVNQCFDFHLTNRSLVDFVFNEGKIQFFDIENDGEIGISLIEIKEDFQKKGIFTNLIRHIISHNFIERIWIFQTSDLMSLLLQTRKFDGKYFQNRFTGEFLWVRAQEYDLDRMPYDHIKSQEISDKLSHLMDMAKEQPMNIVQKIIYGNNDFRRQMC